MKLDYSALRVQGEVKLQPTVRGEVFGDILIEHHAPISVTEGVDTVKEASR